MYKKQLTAVAVALSLNAFSLHAEQYQAQFIEADSEKAIKDNYIVVFNTPSVLNLNNSLAISEFAVQQSRALSNKYDVEVKRHFGNTLNGVLVKADKIQLKSLMQDSSIKYIEQDQMMYVRPLVATNADQVSPTWGLDRVDQRNLPLDNNYHYDFDGSGVTAYVIDTGVLNTHSEFGGRSSSGYDFIDNDSNATDCNGHGTHVAGTIGGATYGVAKNVNIVGVRVLGCSGSGSNSGVIAGINWVKNNASGPSVANMSLGGGASQATDDAVNAAVAAGITFVVAAGNDNSNACNYSPARASDALTVGSTTNSDSRSSFSNYGSCLDIYAPGSSITSAWYNSNNATNTISGTSMAAPHVAGVAALYLDETPSSSPSQIESKLITQSTSNKVTDAKSGSPNKLLFSLNGDGGGCGNNCPVDETELTNNTSVTVSGATGSETVFFIDVPAGTSSLNVNLSGGSGDADIYVQQGSAPTQSSYQCRPYKNGNNESCNFTNPTAGKWYVMVRGYSSYSNVSLTASFNTSSGGCNSADCLDNGVPETNLSGTSSSETFYTIEVPANKTLTVQIAGNSGDADLYVRAGSKPTTSNYDCRPYLNGSNETCSINSGQGGTFHIMLKGYTSYSGLSLTASY
ncbi:S8 family serine peptidase [Shewanella waksmanii]|uniref:S8 family serine peptidase n=1 Tax=Shewanella waksmanii TaxID=213783 RepID=UPI003734DF43